MSSRQKKPKTEKYSPGPITINDIIKIEGYQHLSDDEAFEVIMQLKSLAEVTLKIISYERIS